MKNVYSVGQINSYIKNMFTQDYMLRSVYVKGEASNVRYHSSGHIYFTLKDKSGTLNCIMFSSYRKGMDFRMEDGQQVVVGGSIEVYERDGKYQLYAKEIILAGAGLLYEKFEKLKKELSEMGMFAPEYKKPIPKYATKIGVVTAEGGAAVQDIINITKRRNPYVQLILYPAIVQGDGAKESIVNGIRALDMLGLDVIIVGRGGGSIEDLWAFNEEIVAQAIFECETPIVSAVGHETDTTIADYVADLRAPTPSAAAELTVFAYSDFIEKLVDYRRDLDSSLNVNIKNKRMMLENLENRLKANGPMGRLKEYMLSYDYYQEKLNTLMDNILLANKKRLELNIERMKVLSPLDKLKGGYAYVSDDNGHAIKSAASIKSGDIINFRLSDGEASARVESVKL